MDWLRRRIAALRPKLVSLRRALHAWPELGFTEKRTSALIRKELASAGVPARPLARTGVVGLVRGARPGRTVLIRADMDGLPVVEQNDVPYRSRRHGLMHACGHDGHVAIGLTAARVLQEMRRDLRGNVKFMFQPAEEGPGGALPMIREGLLKNPRVEAALALHLWNELPVGQVGVRAGPVFAAVDEFILTVRGRGGHGAAPHQTVDPIVVAAQIVVAFQGVVARKIAPLHPSVITIGKIEGGTKCNIIPETATLHGTVRSFDAKVRRDLERWIRRTVEGICRAAGARVELRYQPHYPATVNDPAVCDAVRAAASEVVGARRVVEQEPTMGSEDMSEVLERVPGCYLMLGSRNRRKGLQSPHHSPTFNFDEDALPIGVEVLVRSARRLLDGEPPA